MVALLLATAINLQMRAVMLTNAFAAKITYAIFSCIRYPIKAWSDNEVGDVFVVSLIRFTSVPSCYVLSLLHHFIKYVTISEILQIPP